MRRRARYVGTRFGLALGLLAALAGPAAAADAITADRAPSPCRVPGIASEVRCGTVQRPLDPAQAAGRQIAVHYVLVPALAWRKLPDPVFLLAGGPGQSAAALAPAVLGLFSRLNNRRDLVFVDQRGTGRSAPLACDAPPQQPLAELGDTDAQAAELRRCRSALAALPHAAQPGDLGHYTTWVAMQDLDAVRRQLGAERINLVGASYGTRAALDYQRQFPAHVRRSVLDGVAPPDMALPVSFSRDSQAAFDAMLQACAAEPACQRRHPTLRADATALLAGLPRRIETTHPVTGARESFVLQRDALLALLRGPLYTPALGAALPEALAAAVRGRFEPLFALGSASGGGRKAGAVALGMHFSVVCSEDLPTDAATRAALLAAQGHDVDAAGAPGADFGRSFEQLYTRICADWPRGVVPAAFYRVAPSAAPVLLLSGGIDPATPPRHAERVARALGPKARSVVVAQAGHGLMGVGCARDVLWRFIDAADDAAALAVDATCLAQIPRPPAFEPVGAAK